MEEINGVSATTSAPSHIARRDSDDDEPRTTSDTPTNQPTSDNPQSKEDADTSFTLFVSGVAPAVTEDDLRELFSPYGPLSRVQIMRDPHRPEPHRGFGFVAFLEQAAAEKAIGEQHGAMWRERRLAVEMAKRSKPHGPTPGRYNGRREGGGGGGGGGRGDSNRRHYRPRSPRRRHNARSRSRSPARSPARSPGDPRHHYRSSSRRDRSSRASRSRSPADHRRYDSQSYYRPTSGSASAYAPPPYGYPPPPPAYAYPPAPTQPAPQPAPPNDPYVPERPAFYPPHQPPYHQSRPRY